jgi:hypothetical protein
MPPGWTARAHAELERAADLSIGHGAVARDYAIGGVAFAQTVIAPPPSAPLPLSSIPHAPVRWSDALLLIAIIGALLAVARSVRARRGR